MFGVKINYPSLLQIENTLANLQDDKTTFFARIPMPGQSLKLWGSSYTFSWARLGFVRAHPQPSCRLNSLDFGGYIFAVVSIRVLVLVIHSVFTLIELDFPTSVAQKMPNE